jgi:hypothetical protein
VNTWAELRLKEIETFRGGGLGQGCQMVSFQTKNPNLVKFWRALEWKMSVYSMAI